MTVAVPILPSPQLAALNDAYRKAVARKRIRATIAAAVFFAALAAAAIGAEVDLGNRGQVDPCEREPALSRTNGGIFSSGPFPRTPMFHVELSKGLP